MYAALSVINLTTILMSVFVRPLGIGEVIFRPEDRSGATGCGCYRGACSWVGS